MKNYTRSPVKTQLIIVATAAFIVAGFYSAGVVLMNTHTPYSSIFQTEAWSLLSLFLFAIPIAAGRAVQAPKKALQIFLTTIVASICIDIVISVIYQAGVAHAHDGIQTIALNFQFYEYIILSGPLKVGLVEFVGFLCGVVLRKRR